MAERGAQAQQLSRPGQVRLEGLLGEALEANRRGRLSHFIIGPDSPAIAIFDPAHREHNEEGDWYGEHAGKWLAAAAKAGADRPPKGPWPQPARTAVRDAVVAHARAHPAWGHR